MNKRETVQVLVDSIQQGDFDHAQSLLTDNFMFRESIAKPVNKAAWLEMSIRMKKAFPDLNYHFKIIGTEGDVVRFTTQLSGTHTEAFDLTNMNMGMIPATNKKFSVKIQKTKATITEDKISAWVSEPNDMAGLGAILGQLGIKSSTE